MEPVLNHGLSIIVPVFNEAEGLQNFLAQLETLSERCAYPLEITLVNDGSTDGSAEILKTAPCTVITHDQNTGYGSAIKSGIQHSKYEAIVIIDADGTYQIDDILSVVSHLDVNDMVVGARIGQGAKIPLARRPAKWLIRKFASWLVGRAIPDLNSGLRAFRRKEALNYFRLLPDGFSLTTTITIAMHAAGRQVHYQKIHYGKRAGTSKFHPIKDTWNLIMLILRTVVLIRPLNVFLPLSFSLMFLAFLVLVISKFFLGQFMDATFIVLVTTSIQLFVLGLIADLIVRINLWTH